MIFLAGQDNHFLNFMLLFLEGIKVINTDTVNKLQSVSLPSFN